MLVSIRSDTELGSVFCVGPKKSTEVDQKFVSSNIKNTVANVLACLFVHEYFFSRRYVMT